MKEGQGCSELLPMQHKAEYINTLPYKCTPSQQVLLSTRDDQSPACEASKDTPYQLGVD